MPEKSILIADDDIQIRRMLSRFLENENYRFFEVSNGKEAVDIVRNHCVDLAILDIVMPEMNGIEVLKRIKEIDDTIGVLMITGYAKMESLREILFDYGAFDYLIKPFDSAELKIAVRRALRNREVLLKSNLAKGELERRIVELEQDLKERTFSQRESQIKYRDIVEASRDGIAITQGDYLMFANIMVMESTGYTTREILGTPFAKFIHPDDWRAALAKHQKRLTGEKVPEVSVFRIIRKDGSFLWVEDRAAMTLWNGGPAALHVIRDISERMKNEETLTIRDAAMAASISGIVIADLEGNVTYANMAFVKMWGYSNTDELMGKPIRKLFHSQIKGAKAVEVLQTEGGYVGDVVALRKEGSTFPVQVSASMVLDESDRPICMMGSFLDLTKQKQAEEVMMRTEKLSSLGQLSAGLAHELRNPLAVVSSCSQFCLDNLKLDQQVRENFQVIYRNSQRASKLISELLAFARPDALTTNDIDMNEVVTTALQMIRMEADPARVIFVQRLKEGLPQVRGDKEKLSQVFLNLLQNAIHAVSGKGTITVESRCMTSDNLVEVAVMDDGPGIPEEHRKKIFDPFFTTKPGGTGLGLSIGHSIVEQHMGTIRVEPVEDGGVRVGVRLPVSTKGA